MNPFSVFTVFPCIGSVTHKTLSSASVTASIKRGRCSLNFSAPMRLMSVMRPGTFSGFRVLMSDTTDSPSDLSEILIPMGLEMPRKYSMCAPSG